MSVALSIKGLFKTFKGSNSPVLNDISFSLNKGKILALTGESGCGKTTLLRIIAGFEEIQSGSVYLSDQKVAGTNFFTKPEERNVGLVFQDLALFPHMTIEKNIGYGLKKLNKKEKEERISEVLELTNLTEFTGRFPHELSGGQKQRVALARALAVKPRLLLMDEPFSNLDEILRVKVRHEIKTILQKSEITTILVTHDSLDAFNLADEIAILKQGKLIQMGTPLELYEQPGNPYVARFFGEISMISAVKDSNGILTKFGPVNLPIKDESIIVGIRPRAITIYNEKTSLSGKVDMVRFLGEFYEYVITCEDGSEHLHLRTIQPFYKVNELIHFKIDLNQIKLFPAAR